MMLALVVHVSFGVGHFLYKLACSMGSYGQGFTVVYALGISLFSGITPTTISIIPAIDRPKK